MGHQSRIKHRRRAYRSADTSPVLAYLVHSDDKAAWFWPDSDRPNDAQSLAVRVSNLAQIALPHLFAFAAGQAGDWRPRLAVSTMLSRHDAAVAIEAVRALFDLDDDAMAVWEQGFKRTWSAPWPLDPETRASA